MEQWSEEGMCSSTDSEILIYIAAHGESYGKNSLNLQGEKKGSLSLQDKQLLDEEELKSLVRKYFSAHNNVTIVIDACKSGAFIS